VLDCRFKCGREIKKRTTIWGLRVRLPPHAPSFSLPSVRPVSDALLKELWFGNKRLKFLPPSLRCVFWTAMFIFYFHDTILACIFNASERNTSVMTCWHVIFSWTVKVWLEKWWHRKWLLNSVGLLSLHRQSALVLVKFVLSCFLVHLYQASASLVKVSALMAFWMVTRVSWRVLWILAWWAMCHPPWD
jgi:hypothetical protein